MTGIILPQLTIGPKLIQWTPLDEGDLSTDCSDFARLPRDSFHTAWNASDSAFADHCARLFTYLSILTYTDRTVLSCLADGVNWALLSQLVSTAEDRLNARDGTFAVTACWSTTSGRRMLARLATTGSHAKATLSLHVHTDKQGNPISDFAPRESVWVYAFFASPITGQSDDVIHKTGST